MQLNVKTTIISSNVWKSFEQGRIHLGTSHITKDNAVIKSRKTYIKH